MVVFSKVAQQLCPFITKKYILISAKIPVNKINVKNGQEIFQFLAYSLRIFVSSRTFI